MGRPLSTLAVILAALLGCPAARAQPCCPAVPYAVPPPPPAPAPSYPALVPQGTVPPFAVELLGGQASGLRVQGPVLPGGEAALVAEGFYGRLTHRLGSSEALGAGGRLVWRAEDLDCWNSILLGPGVDVFFQLNRNDLILLTPSLDVAWLHDLAPGVGFEAGVEAGLGVGVAGRRKDGASAQGEVTPLISGYLGLRF